MYNRWWPGGQNGNSRWMENKPQVGCGTILGSLATAAVILLLVLHKDAQVFGPGTHCYARATIIAPVDKETYEEFLNATKLRDELGIQQLEAQGRLVTVDANTRLLVLKTIVNITFTALYRRSVERRAGAFHWRRVRILEGENKGKTVLLSDFVLQKRKL